MACTSRALALSRTAYRFYASDLYVLCNCMSPISATRVRVLTRLTGMATFSSQGIYCSRATTVTLSTWVLARSYRMALDRSPIRTNLYVYASTDRMSSRSTLHLPARLENHEQQFADP